MTEQVTPHVALHGGAHNLCPVDYAKMHAKVRQIHDEKRCRPFQKQRQIQQRQLLLQHQLDHIGKKELEQRTQQ